MRFGRLGCFAAGWLAVLSCLPVPAQAQISLEQNVRRQVAEVMEEKESRTPVQQKIGSRLLYASKMLRGQPLTRSIFKLPRITNSLRMQGRDNLAQVDIDGAVAEPLLAAIRAAAGRIESALPDYHAIRAWVPLLAVENLAARDDVWNIRPASLAMTASSYVRPAGPGRPASIGSRLADLLHYRMLQKKIPLGVLFSPVPAIPVIIDTGGIIAHGVNLINSSINGAGVKVAAMSDGVSSVPVLQGSNELPANITIVPGQQGVASGDEGTALLQIIYNLAPGASLYFATGGTSLSQTATNIHTLVDTYHVDIIIDDEEYTDDAVFQDGALSQAVNYAYSKGVVYFSAAENDNNLDSGLSGTWEGDFQDSGDTLTLPSPVNKSYHYHLFQTGTEYLKLGHQTGDTTLDPNWVFLQWADPWGSSCNDYDLIITDSSGNLVDLSTDVQHCSFSNPVELVPWSGDPNGAPTPGELVWIVKTTASAAVAMHLNTGRGTLLNPSTDANVGTQGAIIGHAATSGVVGVGAVGVNTTNGSQGGGTIFLGGAQNPVEKYSADGPRRIFFDQYGTPLTAGAFTFASGGGAVRAKPDLLAADGGQSTPVGYAPFFYGTSASAPHAAAIGALVKSADPYITPASVIAAMKSTALVVTANPTQPNGVGVRTQGAGIAMANLAVAAVTPRITVQTSPISQGFSISGSGCVLGSYNGSTTQTMYTDAVCTVTLTNTTIITGPGARYVFRNWSDAVTANPRTLTVPVGPATFTANYAMQYQLTTNVTPAGGGAITISPISGDGYYDSGASVQLTAVPAAGYSFSGFSGDLGGGSNPQSVTMSAARSVTATFVLTATAPVLAITSTHSGNFTQGQTGATYTVAVANQSASVATSGAVTVTEIVPSGLTLVSMAGSLWNCPAGTNRCTRNDALAHGASYPAITVTVNVSFTAASPQVNAVNVSGGGAPVASATDPTTIVLAPILSITKTHSGNFTQGQTGATYTVTVSNAAGTAPASGLVTVTENVPAGLTLVSMSGTNWSCVSGSNTCTRSDVLAAGFSYASITVTVNVAAGASSPQINSVTLSGGGSAPAGTTDSTTINATSLGTTTIVEGPAAGADTVLLSVTPPSGSWTAQSNAAWLHLAAGSTSGIGNAVIHFTFDANGGAAVRPGTLTIGGQTLTVTQAGSAYVAGSAVVTLVSSGLNGPGTLSVDGSGNVYFADSSNNAIKEWIASTQLVTTLLSSGLNFPAAVALDGQGNVYIADSYNNAIKEWNASTHVVTTLVSSGLSEPANVAVDGQGNVYIADTSNNAIKEWNASTQTVTTLVSAGLNTPFGVAVDALGNVYIADTSNNAIKEWSASTHLVTTLLSAGLNYPTAVAVDGRGNLFIADAYNDAIKEWNALTQAVTTLVSSGIQSCYGVAVDGIGNVYISDTFNNAIKVDDLGYVALGSTSKSEPPAAGSDSVSVQVLPAALPVTATSDQTWLSINSTSGGTISFSFTANTGAARTAHITVLGQQITVMQSAPGVPVLAIAKTHSGNFTQGQAGAAYTVTVSNISTTATSGAVTVTETAPTGLTLQSMSGSGWTCTAGGNTCQRSNSLAAGSSYPSITVTVNVLANATSPQVNAVSVSGGGSAMASTTDSTTIIQFITVTTSPAGLAIVVDGTAYIAPQTFNWVPGANHTLNVTSPQGAGSYVFANWSDGAAQSHTIVTPGSTAT